jgi:hypothetical protein
MPYLDVHQQIPFASGSESSRETAVAMRDFIGPQGERVYARIAAYPLNGQTQKEIASALDLGRASVCARVRALEQAGRIVKIPDLRRGGCCCYTVAKP